MTRGDDTRPDRDTYEGWTAKQWMSLARQHDANGHHWAAGAAREKAADAAHSTLGLADHTA